MTSAAPTTTPELDVITIGRVSVDLYGQQIGSRLEDVRSFAKSIGGCPANIAIGTSRLGLKSALLSRVGAEQMGGYVREQMIREGVSVDGLKTDPDRLTALVLLSVEDDETFPLIFYRENCADMALCEEDIDEDFILTARSVLVSGTHFSKPHTEAAQRKAIRIAKENGRKVVFDIDYRPNLWGLAGHADGESRYIASDIVSEKLKTVLADCDLIIGTEEEILIASGESDLLQALKTIRGLSPTATIVLKRGPMGCIIYEGEISDNLEDGIVGQGFPIEVYNVLGVGDSFMSGFLRGWLRDEPLATCATWANACGAFAVSRLLCSPEIPTWDELQYFIENGSEHKALRKDEDINHVHWATTRKIGPINQLMSFAIDHRSQLEDMTGPLNVPREKIAEFKKLAVDATKKIAGDDSGYGMLLDGTYGTQAFYNSADTDFWIGRPIEKPGSRPLEFDHMEDLGTHLAEWPSHHCVKVLCFYHPDDAEDLKYRQEKALLHAFEAARKNNLEILVEIICSKHGPVQDDTTSRVMTRLYELGIKPDWWKLEPQKSEASWNNIQSVITANDQYCRGIVMLGLEAPLDVLKKDFELAANFPSIKGFAVGRSLFAEVARNWFAGKMDDAAAVDQMAENFAQLVDCWKEATE